MSRGRKRKQQDPYSDNLDSMPVETNATDELSDQEEEAAPSSEPGNKGIHVNPKRVRELRGGSVKKGPVIYW